MKSGFTKMNGFYNKYSDYIKNKYGVKAYKLPVNIAVTCPNRDGNISFGGCSYCGDIGVGFECMPETSSVREQLFSSREHIKRRYKAEKFIAYFQNFSNTYLPIQMFKSYITQAAECDVCEIAVSTRPDCVSDEHIQFLKNISSKFNIDITVELGLQTANYHTLNKINRGHTLAEYIDACFRIKKAGLDLCTHVILNLPYDSLTDAVETSKIISTVGSDYVKLHALYLMEGTKLASQYLNGEFCMITPDEYIERVITFLEYLSSEVVVQRLIGRAPAEGAVFVNWGMSWRKIQNNIEDVMQKTNRHQGSRFNYLGGGAVLKMQGF